MLQIPNCANATNLQLIQFLRRLYQISAYKTIDFSTGGGGENEGKDQKIRKRSTSYIKKVRFSLELLLSCVSYQINHVLFFYL